MFNKTHVVTVIVLGDNDVFLGHEVYIFKNKVSEQEWQAVMDDAFSKYAGAVRTSSSVTPVKDNFFA